MVASAIGASVLIGWAFHYPLLVTWSRGAVSQKVNTAICFLLAGIALFLRLRSRRVWRDGIASACAITVAASATMTLVEYVVGCNLGIDELLVVEHWVGAGTSHPGRMAPNTAVAFVLSGIALHVIGRRSERAWRTAQALTVAALLIVMIALIGYLYGAHVLVGLFSLTRMAIHTMLAFVALSIGIIALGADKGWIAELTTPGPGRVVTQRLLPAALAIPVVIGLLTLTGYRSGLYDPAFLAAIMAVAETLSFTTLVWLCARFLNETERERTLASVDELTGLLNRRALLVRGEDVLAAARRFGTGALLFFIDLDGMKGINDGLGHAAGDRALVETASILRATFRDGDCVSRLGGDEFAVLAAKAKMANSAAILARLQMHLDRMNATPNRQFVLQLSIGVTPYVLAADGTISDLLQRADAHMYQQKRARKPTEPAIQLLN